MSDIKQRQAKWRSDYLNHPLFAPLSSVLHQFNHLTTWPTLHELNRLLQQHPHLRENHIHCVTQASKTSDFLQQYESRIYLHGELQTRTANWHDFFNYCVWLTFPKIKLAANALQFQEINARNNQQQRSNLENALTLFDENGAIITCSHPPLLNLLQQHQWHKLFWDCRELVKHHVGVYIVGHALYEKGLQPYLGMTANSIVLPVSESFYAQSTAIQLNTLDERISGELAMLCRNPRLLQPWPLYGMPGWDSDNECASYYANTDYFRPARQH